MIAAAAVAGFVIGFVGSMPIGGPVSLLVFHRGIHGRYRDGWAIGLGGAIPEGIYCALAILGVSVIRERFVFLDPVARGLGILWLFGIGLYFVLGRRKDLGANAVAKPSRANRAGQFCLGLTISALNPTFLLTWSATATMLYSFANLTFHIPEGLAFAASVVVGTAAWFGLLLALMRRFRNHFSLFMLQRLIRGIGMVLIAVAIVAAAWVLFPLTAS